MKIYTLQLGPIQANCYIVQTAPDRCIAVDIGGDSRRFLDFIAGKGLSLRKILLTHGHFDHMLGVEEVRKATGAEVYVHTDDAKMLVSPEYSLFEGFGMFGGFPAVTDYTAVFGDCWINDGDCSFKVVHTPGHSEGSVCYICDDVMFSGDTLFSGSCGRTDLAGGNTTDLVNSLRHIYMIDRDLKVYPGHGEESSLAYEKQYNPYLSRFKGEL
ncbi:MAG: MBL fold metallo-hydrolase [Ruminococcus sp.]|nr:MBL fold metallo-hydrolase [Ruminococcus sp.]